MHVAGDDMVLLMRDPTPVAQSLYSTSKLHHETIDRLLPAWRARVGGEIGPEKKALFYLAECLPAQVARSLPVNAVVLPRLAGAGETIPEYAEATEITGAAGLLAIAPSTIFILPGDRRAPLGFLSSWMRGVPVHSLLAGRDLMSSAARLRQIMHHPKG